MANKEFDNVQLFAEYDSSVGSNVMNVFGNKSKENIAYSLSKIKNWFPWLVPTNGSTGQILEWYNNVPTWRANTNADTVKQTHSTDTDFHPLVLGAPHSASAWGSAISETTDQVYMNKGIYVKPSTSTIYATAFVGKVTHPTIPGTGADTTSSVTPLHGQGFTTVDVVTRDSNGHVTGINTKTVTLPAQYVHPTYTRTDTASTASPAHGGTFTAIDSVTSTNGHVTAVNLKTVTLPAQYVHPTYIDETTANFYKIKITNGHISAATAIAKGDVSTFLNLLDTGSSTPTDADYYISQYVGGGTTTTSYHRRPMSALWSYVKGKADPIYAPLNHTHAYTVPVGITVKTGSSDQSHITLQTLMTWLITTKGYITSNTARSLTLYTSWSYAGNDILQLTIDGTAYELQLAGVIIEFDGFASDYQTGTFRLRIHSSPTVSFTPASGYTQFPASHIAEYTCNGSGYSPTWKMLVDKGDTVTRTGGGASGTWGISISGSAEKLGTSTVGSGSRPIYLNAGTPTQCDTPTSGAWWNGVPGVASNGVMEVGKYIDFHGTNTTTADYDYRIQAGSAWLDLVSPTTQNKVTVISPDYSVIQFMTTKTGYTITQPVIYAYPLTTSGLAVLFQSGGNTVIGGGESASTLYTNDYDSMTTVENESLYLASDSSEIHLITNAQSYGTRKVLKVAAGQLVKTGGLWIWARDTAPVYANKPNSQDGGYYPAWFAKTKSGGWSMGVLSTQDNLYLTYTTDTDYSGGTNNNTYHVQFQNKSGTVALTSDIPAADDHKVTQNNLTSGGTFPVILGGNLSAATVTDYVNKKYDALRLGVAIGTTSTDGYGELLIGNATASGTAGNACGQISIYSSNTAGAILRASSTASWRTFYFPGDKGGTVAVTTDLAAYLPLAGGTMTGTITHPANTVAINLRADNTSTWQNTIMTQSAGDEAVVFANANARTSWMFVNGEDSIAHPENNRWQSLTPALQIKGGCVAIGKLIPSGTTPTTKLDIAGDASISGTLYIDSKKYTVASSSSTSYNAAITGSFTANRTITIPDDSGYIALGSSTGAANKINVSRTSQNTEFKPGKNQAILYEFAGEASNLPTSAYYHILTSEGPDDRYAVQLALGMTTDGAYYRRCSTTWGLWKPLTSITVYSSSTGATTTTAFAIPSGYNAMRVTVKKSGSTMLSTIICSLNASQADWGGFIQTDNTTSQGMIVGAITPILIKKSGTDASATLTLYRGKTYTFAPWASTTEVIVITTVELIP